MAICSCMSFCMLLEKLDQKLTASGLVTAAGVTVEYCYQERPVYELSIYTNTNVLY